MGSENGRSCQAGRGGDERGSCSAETIAGRMQQRAGAYFLRYHQGECLFSDTYELCLHALSDAPQVFLFIFLIKATIVSMHKQLYYGDIRCTFISFCNNCNYGSFQKPFLVHNFTASGWFWVPGMVLASLINRKLNILFSVLSIFPLPYFCDNGL